jgi:hypothetical protein
MPALRVNRARAVRNLITGGSTVGTVNVRGRCRSVGRSQPFDITRGSVRARDFGPKGAERAAWLAGAVISGGGSETLAEAGRDRIPLADRA